MSYEHCEKHDADATNGCAQCEAEEAERVAFPRFGDRRATRRDVACTVCKRLVALRSVTTSDPECPELISPLPDGDVWFFFAGDGHSIALHVACSHECARVITRGA